jgi:hypothetical protein
VVESLEGYLDSMGIEDSSRLCDLVKEDFKDHDRAKNKVFHFGDAWTGAVILSHDLTASSKGERQLVGIVDWEFSGEGRGPNGDMAQLLADLHAYLVESQPRSLQYKSVMAFTEGHGRERCLVFTDCRQRC